MDVTPSLSICHSLSESTMKEGRECRHFPGEADGVEVVLALADEGVVGARQLQRLHLRVERHARGGREGVGGVMGSGEEDVGRRVGRDADRRTPAQLAHCKEDQGEANTHTALFTQSIAMF